MQKCSQIFHEQYLGIMQGNSALLSGWWHRILPGTTIEAFYWLVTCGIINWKYFTGYIKWYNMTQCWSWKQYYGPSWIFWICNNLKINAIFYLSQPKHRNVTKVRDMRDILRILSCKTVQYLVEGNMTRCHFNIKLVG